MKGIVFDIKHCAVHDGPGLRTTVFLKGCPLNCWWCQNPESITQKPETVETEKKVGSRAFREIETIGRYLSVDEVWSEVQKDLVFYEESGGGVTFSGGEPLYQVNFLQNLLMKAKSCGVHSAVDTTGFTSRINFDAILPFTDLFLYDIKHLDDQLHKKFTGVSNRIILQNLESIVAHKKDVIIRFPLIPGFNDSQEHIEEFIGFLSRYQASISGLHILPYHENAAHKYKKLKKPFKMYGAKTYYEEELTAIKERFQSNGFNVKIRG